jgi:FecR protein
MKSSRLYLFALILVAFPLFADESIAYRFDQVRSKVVVTSHGAEMRAAQGTIAHDEDRVRTGWLGHAMLAAPRYAAEFEIFSGSEVTLAGGTPGLILSLDRGRLKAMFDKITGNEPRMVKTPGALLAVRGTRYGVEVGRNGDADLVVFEGTVEVKSALAKEPVLVHAGEGCHFGTSSAPMVMPMKGMNEGMWQQHGAGGMGGMSGGSPGMNGTPGQRGTGTTPMMGGHHGH